MDDAGAAAFIDAMAMARFGVPGEWFQIAVAEKDADALIGDIGVCVRDDLTQTAEIGFTIAPAAQGRGLGTEAVIGVIALLFDSGGIGCIEGITDVRNVPSIRLLERVGMRLARVQDTMYKGEMCTEHVYAIERSALARA
jgi:RimJ/RimL family protein N-acetyltransferase